MVHECRMTSEVTVLVASEIWTSCFEVPSNNIYLFIGVDPNMCGFSG